MPNYTITRSIFFAIFVCFTSHPQLTFQELFQVVVGLIVPHIAPFCLLLSIGARTGLIVFRYEVAYLQVHWLIWSFHRLCRKLLLERRLYQYLKLVVLVLHRSKGVSPWYVILLLVLIGLAGTKLLLFISVYSPMPAYSPDYHFSRFWR